MEEHLCSIEICKGASYYIARVQSDIGGLREYKRPSFDEVFEQVVIDIQEEFEASLS